ncbi:hypothetical protein AG1IA_00969 [Rhizoctonia solani AG-1 IA]|uniref:Uncharacterized protein n=1 Tax=Thanatephorus cucumeris (strain AG1-IA) TaxID=983506 RepID=L8X8P1_THACA|nr:hypothetical protein AG1IA_00969 [Rhizoctonia solani AG-1 IA]
MHQTPPNRLIRLVLTFPRQFPQSCIRANILILFKSRCSSPDSIIIQKKRLSTSWIGHEQGTIIDHASWKRKNARTVWHGRQVKTRMEIVTSSPRPSATLL